MKPFLRCLCLCVVPQGRAKKFQQVDEDVATVRYHILLVEKFSSLL